MYAPSFVMSVNVAALSTTAVPLMELKSLAVPVKSVNANQVRAKVSPVCIAVDVVVITSETYHVEPF